MYNEFNDDYNITLMKHHDDDNSANHNAKRFYEHGNIRSQPFLYNLRVWTESR